MYKNVQNASIRRRKTTSFYLIGVVNDQTETRDRLEAPRTNV